MNPFKWFSKKPKIKVNLIAKVIQGYSSCEVEVAVVRESSITCTTKKLVFGKSRFCQGDSYKISMVVEGVEYVFDANLGLVNFSFTDDHQDRFTLEFITNSEVYELLRKHSNQ